MIQLSKKLEEGTPEDDALLMKQIVDNLRENLPSDTSWKVIWSITCPEDSPWRCMYYSTKRTAVADGTIHHL